MELTDLIRNHKTKYNGSWDELLCTRCGKSFSIGADMCDAELIEKELKRIDKIPCVEKP